VKGTIAILPRMNQSYNYVTLDNPNLSLLDPATSNGTLGEYMPTPNPPAWDEDVVSAVRSFDMYLPNFSLREYQGIFNHRVVLKNNEGVGLDMLGICLILKGEVRTYHNSSEACEPSFNFSQNFKYDPQNEFRHLMSAGKPFHIAHFEVRPDYFMQFLPETKWADSLVGVFERKSRISGQRFMPILSAQERAMQNILDTPFEGKMAYMMMEASLIQIILLQFHAMFGAGAIALPRNSAREAELIHAVRDFIKTNFLDDHSLTSLSRQFGTNTNKLMRLFREAFGESIFDYITALRMTYARDLLRDEDRQINEVARIVGYKNPNHFSTAFRKKYGIRPSEVKI
jgi:AraC-like DNA-binding protein